MTADDSPFDSLCIAHVEIITHKNGAFEAISNVTLRLPAKRMVMNTLQYFQFSKSYAMWTIRVHDCLISNPP